MTDESENRIKIVLLSLHVGDILVLGNFIICLYAIALE